MTGSNDGTDDDLDVAIGEAIRGDRAAQSRVLEAQHDHIRRTLYRLLGKTSDIDDLVQTVMERMLGALPTYRRESSLKTWVGGICVHVMKDHLRKRKVRSIVVSSDAGDDRVQFAGLGDPEQESAHREMLARCERALAVLSPEQRAVFVFRVIEGHSIEEVATMMQSAVSTTRMRLYWGRKAFFKALEKELGTDAPPARAVEDEP